METKMIFKRFTAMLLVALMIILSFSGCEENYKEAFIYIEFDRTAEILDPQLATTTEELTVCRSVFDTLLRYDGFGKIVPSAAESYSKDGLVYTFKLKKDGKWTDGTPLTADDFLYGIERAVSPETSAPYANSLFSIKGAEEIYGGKAELSSLGVTAVDEHTLKIELKRDDPEFLKVLTSAITMPCNRKYFEGCMGKYGLTLDTTPSCGSYYIKKWTSNEKFLIRLAKNLEFTGDFEANSMRIYYTCGEKDTLGMLENENTDLMYISTEDYDKVAAAGFEMVSTKDTCYALFINGDLDEEVRKALLTSVDHSGFKDKLPSTHSVADTIYPSIVGAEGAKKVTEYIKYAPEEAAKLYSELIKKGTDLSGITIKYPSDSAAAAVAKSVAAQWQQNLSLFINIEELSPAAATSAYNFGSYDILIVPFTATTGTISAYHAELGFSYTDTAKAEKALYEELHCYPLYFTSTNIASIHTVDNLKSCLWGGILDVAMLIKKQ